MIDDETQYRLLFQIGRVFSPTAPINKRDLFAGRVDQVDKLSGAISSRGAHAMMFGDRGVGKTSLANIMQELFQGMGDALVVKTDCTETDTFQSVWERAFDKIPVIVETSTPDEQGIMSPQHNTLYQYMHENKAVRPSDVRELLEFACNGDWHSEFVLVFDEFDRLAEGARRLFADTIKGLSDNSAPVTLVLVGVARDVVELIGEHKSIDRCLTQVFMPPMNRTELGSILSKALAALKMTADVKAQSLILTLSQGFPHYTHLLGQEAAKHAVKMRRTKIVPADVGEAVQEALANIKGTITDEYYKASEGQRKGTLFPKVLLACALAQTSDLGFFRSTDVRLPMQELTDRAYEERNFSIHLNKLATEDSRGPVFERTGSRRRYSYRFKNAMLRPYIIMKALEDGTLKGSLLTKLTGPVAPPENLTRETGGNSRTPGLFDDL